MLLSRLADISTSIVMPQPQELTFIMGSKCTNGVVLIGDRKVTWGNTSLATYEEKVFSPRRSIVWGCAGSKGYAESYRYFVETGIPRLRQSDGDDSIDAREFMNLLLSVHGDLVGIYHSKFEDKFAILIGMRTEAEKGQHDTAIYLIHGEGGLQSKKEPVVIGSGGYYAKFFINRLWDESMTMMEVAEIGYFCIKTIQELRLSYTVGLEKGDPKNKYPQVFFIPDNPQPDGTKNGRKVNILPATRGELKSLDQSSSRKFKRLKSEFKTWLNQ